MVRLESNSIWIFEEIYLIIKVKFIIVITNDYRGGYNQGAIWKVVRKLKLTNESKWYLTLTFARKAGVEICLSVDFVSLIELPKLYFPGHVLDFGSGWLIFWIYQSSYL